MALHDFIYYFFFIIVYSGGMMGEGTEAWGHDFSLFG